MKFFKPFTPPTEPEFPDLTVDIRDYGAVEGGQVKVTEAIGSAIADCAALGGGRVVIPAGRWLTGPIHLKDNIDLHFAEGSVVEFSKDFADYLPVVFGILAGNRCYCPSHMLYAYRCKNIAVTGTGELDGHGEAWWYMKHHQPGMEHLTLAGRNRLPLNQRVYDKPEDGVRPRLLQFVECENVLIEGVTLKNSPSWTVHPAWCNNIIVRGLTIENPLDSPNTDGVNFESCRRGLIEDCFVSGGDDLVCLKAGKAEDAWDVGIPCEDIEVRNCRTVDCRGGLTIGSEMSAGVRNAWIHDCHYAGSMVVGVNVKTMKGRGGFIENIDYENITLETASRAAISISLRYNNEPLDDQSQPKINMPKVRNISVENLRCTRANNGIRLWGEEGYELENIHLSNVTIAAKNPASIENVKNLSMENVSLTLCDEVKVVWDE